MLWTHSLLLLLHIVARPAAPGHPARQDMYIAPPARAAPRMHVPPPPASPTPFSPPGTHACGPHLSVVSPSASRACRFMSSYTGKGGGDDVLHTVTDGRSPANAGARAHCVRPPHVVCAAARPAPPGQLLPHKPCRACAAGTATHGSKAGPGTACKKGGKTNPQGKGGGQSRQAVRPSAGTGGGAAERPSSRDDQCAALAPRPPPPKGTAPPPEVNRVHSAPFPHATLGGFHPPSPWPCLKLQGCSSATRCGRPGPLGRRRHGLRVAWRARGSWTCGSCTQTLHAAAPSRRGLGLEVAAASGMARTARTGLVNVWILHADASSRGYCVI